MVFCWTLFSSAAGFLSLGSHGEGRGTTGLEGLAQTGPQQARSPARLPAAPGCLADIPFPEDDSLKGLRQCVDHDDARCARTALQQIYDPRIMNRADFLDLKARVAMLAGERTEAMASIERALEIAPTSYRVRMTEGQIYQNFDDERAAIRSFLLADRLRPRCPDTFYSLGMSLFILGAEYNDFSFYDRAARHFKTALELNAQFDRAEFMLGVVCGITLRVNEAQEHFQNALAMKPENPFYHLHYAVLLDRMGDKTAALRELRLAEEEFPGYTLTHVRLGHVYREMGRYEDARSELETAVRMKPNLPDAHYQLATVYRHLGLKAKAEEEYRKFAQIKAMPVQRGNDAAESTLSRSVLESESDRP
jgi:tetratricopeptide (TPR) repeat protein